MTRGELTGRKGLSPLIATILLIAFAVAIGVLLVNSIFKPGLAIEADPCANTKISLQELPGGASICYETTAQQFQFLIENTGSNNVDSLIVRIINSDQQVEERTVNNVNLAPGRIGQFNIEYKTISPNELTATIIPLTIVAEETKTCTLGKLQSVGVPLC